MSSENGIPSEELIRYTFWQFAIGQLVSIYSSPGIQGAVVGRADFGNHQKYQVAYLLDGHRRLGWFTPVELS